MTIKRIRPSLIIIAALLLSPTVSLAQETTEPPPQEQEQLASPLSPAALDADYSGDQWDDVFIGSPREAIGDTQAAGMVHAIFSNDLGPHSAWTQGWDQGDEFIADTVTAGNRFGNTLAAGDFNGDFQMDLAIGAPGEDFSDADETYLDAGAVNVLYGAAGGLTGLGSQFLTRGYGAELDPQMMFDLFGHALASADFNLDGFTDLAVGAPGGQTSPLDDTGMVRLYYGAPAGLDEEPRLLGQQAPSQDPETGDNFGKALSSGDYNRDGYPDLAVGVPGESVGTTISHYGVVEIHYGSPAGLTSVGPVFRIDQSGYETYYREDMDEFGAALASGDFDNNGFTDLAIAAPGEDIDAASSAGTVHVVYFYSAGATYTQHWQQGLAGVPDTSETLDRFGYVLAAGDFNNDGYDELAISADESLDEGTQGGMVRILKGSPTGLTTTGLQLFREGMIGVGNAFGPYEHFGASLAVGYLDGDDYADLVIGAPGEDVSSEDSAGAVIVLFGASTGLSSSRSQYWTQLSDGLSGVPEANDHFGAAVGTSYCPGCRYPIYLPFAVR